MLEFLWELRQQREILDAKLEAARAARGASDVHYRTSEHGDRLDAMALTITAMLSIMQERFGVTEQQLIARMQEIDVRDGKLDGKVSASTTQCSGCGRMMSARHKRCIYCGGESLSIGAFDGL